jgi:hypothetical protein
MRYLGNGEFVTRWGSGWSLGRLETPPEVLHEAHGSSV